MCDHGAVKIDDRNPLNVRHRIAAGAVSLFGEADYPLAKSLSYQGDPGIFGPGSATWEIIGDASVMVGGIRALLVQAAHPEIVAGVTDHSAYEHDPLGRLSRTTSYVTSTAYGAMPEVEAALAAVRSAHRSVTGTSHRGRTYSANSGSGASWVHNVLTDSFLTANAVFGPHTLTATRADQFAQEQAGLGKLLHAPELPTTRDDLALWIDSHPDIESSPGMLDAVAFLSKPPLPRSALVPYRVLFRAAAAILPPRVASVLGVRSPPGAVSAGRRLAALLRWSIGASPSWWLALERVHERPPDGVHFRYPPPADGVESVFRRS